MFDLFILENRIRLNSSSFCEKLRLLDLRSNPPTFSVAAGSSVSPHQAECHTKSQSADAYGENQRREKYQWHQYNCPMFDCYGHNDTSQSASTVGIELPAKPVCPSTPFCTLQWTSSFGARNKRTTRFRFWHTRFCNLHLSEPSGHARMPAICPGGM